MKLIDALNIINRSAAAGAEVFRVGLVCGFTPLHLQTFLHAELQSLFPDRRVEPTSGLYGDVTGTLESLKREQLDAVVLALEWPDLDARLGIRQMGGWGPSNLDAIVERTQLFLLHVQRLVEQISRLVPVIISLPSLPVPPLFFTAGWQASSIELKLKGLISEFVVALSQIDQVRVLNQDRLDQDSPLSSRLNVKSYWASGFPYHLSHAGAMARLLSLLIRNPSPKKGLITDLDNTFWNGIIGEVGAHDVHWDQNHSSEAHGFYQQMLKSLSEEGVLIAAASKNEPEIVEEAFNRDDLLISREHMSMLEVSWGSKAHAVSQILSAWNIGADSVVFIDDSPLELAEVSAAHPMIECIRFPFGDPQKIYELVLRLRDLFGKERIFEEDQLRLESTRRNAEMRSSGRDIEGFSDVMLEQSGAELTLSLRKDANDARALDLVNKTNQFNLNGKRFTEALWRAYLREPDTFLLTASYKDRFGSLGKIAVMAGRRGPSGINVDTWVMSCRAFARRIEHQCLLVLFQKLEAQEITFDYSATPRNGPIAKFFSEFLTEPPASTVTISQALFDSRCPKLFHHVVELNNE
jgi:FkbH-like protein